MVITPSSGKERKRVAEAQRVDLGGRRIGKKKSVPGAADFDFAVRRQFINDGSKATLWLSPILAELASFPERAWLRSIEVIDWGSATNLHLADFTSSFEIDGWDLGGMVITPSSGNPTTFSVGQQPMTVMMGTSSMPVDGETLALPKVRMSWSCQVNPTNPHPIAVEDRSGHVMSLPGSLPIKSRLVFWPALDGSDIRMAPEGRYLDYVQSKLEPSTLGGTTFSFPFVGHDARFDGRLVPFGGSFRILDGVVTFGETPQTLPTITLKKL